MYFHTIFYTHLCSTIFILTDWYLDFVCSVHRVFRIIVGDLKIQITGLLNVCPYYVLYKFVLHDFHFDRLVSGFIVHNLLLFLHFPSL